MKLILILVFAFPVSLLLAEEQTNTSHINTFVKDWEIKCKAKDENACFQLGSYENDKHNYQKAKNLLKPLCENGSLGSCYVLGNVETSLGNKDEAKKLLDNSCKQSPSGVGCVELGRLYTESGKIDEANALFKKTCDKAENDTFQLNACYELGIYEYSKKNYIEAEKLLYKSCQLVTKGCKKLIEVREKREHAIKQKS
jgi:tetratricopeptide (TPR) repeat protein